MKKLMSILACALCAAFVSAGNYFPQTVNVPAGRTAATNFVDMAKIGCGQIDQISFATTGSNTGWVYVASVDLGTPSTVMTFQGNATTNTVYDLRPRWSASENVNATNQLYSVRKLRLIVNQQSNGAAQSWDFGVYTK